MIIDGLRFYEAVPETSWPFFLPPVRQIIRNGLQFTRPITFLVGENGSGKSTILEAIAEAYGLDVRGGHGGRTYGPAIPVTKSPLGELLKLDLSHAGLHAKAKRSQGFFLRAETAKGVLDYMSLNGVAGYGDTLHKSHGEGYMQVFLGRFQGLGLYLLDEPESALSFHACLALIKQLKQVVQNGSQVICATHSPLLAALPGANILELNDDGIHPIDWKELELTKNWQRFMANPDFYLHD